MENFIHYYNTALDVAIKSHFNQFDKGGMSYIMHSIRVSQNCKRQEAKIVALLHDVLEDGKFYSEDDLCRIFPQEIMYPVKLLTKNKEQQYMKYIEHICDYSVIAMEVKLHDLEDNMDITRLKEVTEKDLKRIEKYHKAYTYIKSRVEPWMGIF